MLNTGQDTWSAMIEQLQLQCLVLQEGQEG